MIATTFQGAPAWLLRLAPDWSQAVRLRCQVASQKQRALTGRQVRQALGTSLRCRMQYRSTLVLEDLARIRNALAAAVDEPVLVPAWMFVLDGADWSGTTISGGITIGWMEGWSTWELNPASPAAWDWVAPVLYGRLEVELPNLLRPDVGEVGFVLEEDGSAEYSLAPGAVTWPSGPALNDTTVPSVFPFRIEWSSRVSAGRPEVEVTRSRVGDAPRMRSSAFYPQSPAMTAEGFLSLHERSDISGILRWWQDRRANVGAHYVTTLTEAGTLAGPAAAGATAIQLVDASLIGSYRFLALGDDAGVQIVRAGNPAGNTVPLVAPLDRAVAPGATIVSLAALARHAGDDLEITFESPLTATCRLAWEELREEYIIPDLAAAPAESRGLTIGEAGIRAWLYKIAVDRAGSQVVYRRTSYERDLTADSVVWTAAPISHSEIRQSVQLDRDELVLEARAETWSSEFLPGRLSGRVLLDVYECDVSGGAGSNVVLRWSGEVSRISSQGPRIRASCAGPYALFDRPVPRLVMQGGCNHTVFDGLCGLTRTDWTFAAAVNATVTGNQVVLKTWSRTAGLPAGWGFANYFALGYLERVSGGVTSRWMILASTAVSAGLVTLTVDRSVVWNLNESVSVVPGCDGRPETCRAYDGGTNPGGKYGNFSRFGGFPFIPASDPKFTPVGKPPASGYGKK